MNRFALLEEEDCTVEKAVPRAPVVWAKKPEVIPQVCVLPFEVKLEAGGPTGLKLTLGTYQPTPLPAQLPTGPRKAVYRSQLIKPVLSDLKTDLSPSLFPQLGDCRSYCPGIWSDVSSVHAAVDKVDPSIALALARNVRIAHNKALAAQYRDVVYLDDLDLPSPVVSMIEMKRARVVSEEHSQKMKHQPQRRRLDDDDEDPEEICTIGGGRIVFNPVESEEPFHEFADSELIEPDDGPDDRDDDRDEDWWRE